MHKQLWARLISFFSVGCPWLGRARTNSVPFNTERLPRRILPPSDGAAAHSLLFTYNRALADYWCTHPLTHSLTACSLAYLHTIITPK